MILEKPDCADSNTLYSMNAAIFKAIYIGQNVFGWKGRQKPNSNLTKKGGGGNYVLFHVTGKARTQLIECHQRTLLFQSEALLLVNKCSLAALSTMPKPLTVWITTNSGKF